MNENFIQLENDDILRLEIRTSNGESTGNYLEFDLEDIELPIKYQNLIEDHKKNMSKFLNQIKIIEKRQDIKGKKALSKNEEDEFRTLKNFFDEEVKIYNEFLGENGVQKLLNGRKIGWSSLQSVDKLIEKQILPELQKHMGNITDKIRKKYIESTNKELSLGDVNE